MEGLRHKRRSCTIASQAPIAQWIEYPASNRVVGGSSPLRCNLLLILNIKFSDLLNINNLN